MQPHRVTNYFSLRISVCRMKCPLRHNALKQLNGHPNSLHNFFCQQGFLSPPCWHRAVKSCLHGKLRSRETDKPVSKKTTKSWIKDLLCKDLGFLRGRRHSFKCGLHMSHRGWMRIHLSHTLSIFFVYVSQSCVLPHYLIWIPAHTTHYVYWLIKIFCGRHPCSED